MIHIPIMLTFVLGFISAGPNQVPIDIGVLVAQTLAADSSEARESPLVPFQSEIEQVSKEYHIPAALIAAIIQEESSFTEWSERFEMVYARDRRVKREANAWSRTHAGIPTRQTELYDRARSMGPMQVMGQVAREQGFSARYLSALFAPRNSIEQGGKLLRHLLDRYPSDTLAAISAYNQGSARRHHGTFANARYVYRVSIAWRAYQKLFARRSNHLPH
jgi:soluble lytic murein transglycosylase-like protein